MALRGAWIGFGIFHRPALGLNEKPKTIGIMLVRYAYKKPASVFFWRVQSQVWALLYRLGRWPNACPEV